MKRNNIIGITFFAVALFVLGWQLTKRYQIVPKDSIVVIQSMIDSLNAYVVLADSLETLAHLPPDTIYRDTVIYESVPVYVESIPVIIDSTKVNLRVYRDSLNIEGEVNAWVQYKVRGYVEGVAEWGYKAITTEIETVIEKPVPYPIVENIEIPTPITGNYLSLAAGGNDKMFIFGVDYDMVKTDYIYGLQYRRFGNASVYGIKIGVNLNTLFNRK
jgi:hypothetical protein